MKTAISIPDSIFQAAEEMAEQYGISRSELYTKAVVSYIAAHRTEAVTQALDEVYGSDEEQSSAIASDVMSMQIRSLPEDSW